MGLQVTGFAIWFHCDLARNNLVVDYKPRAVDDHGAPHDLPVYQTQMNVAVDGLPEEMQRKLRRLAEYITALLEAPEVEIAGVPLKGQPVLNYFQVNIPRVQAVYHASPETRNSTSIEVAGRLPDGARRLINNLLPMCEQLAWDDLRKRLGGQAEPQPDNRKRVLISYKSGSDERQKFVDAIAHRLGREQFLPWYDKWEIKAGDSIARELAVGFQDVAAILIVLTPDYPGERWAREELENAIRKRAEQGIRVIPIIYEPCERPELLGTLRYVDCTNHHEAQIERQFRDVIDALNEVELNPYRR
jgi:hypothetical protein